jgi:hypothetical protein
MGLRTATTKRSVVNTAPTDQGPTHAELLSMDSADSASTGNMTPSLVIRDSAQGAVQQIAHGVLAEVA